jgi:hypothetical protein
MRKLALFGAILALVAVGSTAAAAQTTTAAQLTSRFKAATGAKLVRNKQLSYAGHYTAYDLGAHPSAVNAARYGKFTVYLVTGSDVEADVTDLLADTHTGELGTPGPGNIYWEAGTTLYGDKYWQAKHRYGQNVVLEWTTTSTVRKTDATWKRLHAALTKATK